MSSIPKKGYKQPEDVKNRRIISITEAWKDPERRRKQRETSIRNGNRPIPVEGPSHHLWKENVSYSAAHKWAGRHMKPPKKCKCCGVSLCPICGQPGNIHRCNVDHKYRKRLEDWFWACSQCHKNYDVEHGLVERGKQNGKE